MNISTLFLFLIGIIFSSVFLALNSNFFNFYEKSIANNIYENIKTLAYYTLNSGVETKYTVPKHFNYCVSIRIIGNRMIVKIKNSYSYNLPRFVSGFVTKSCNQVITLRKSGNIVLVS